MRTTCAAIGMAAWSLLPLCVHAEESGVVDRHGRLMAMLFDGDQLAVSSDVRVPVRGWARLPGLTSLKAVKTTRAPGCGTWSGSIEVEAGKRCRYEQTMREDAGCVNVSIRTIAEADLDIEGVFFWLDVPIEVFAGGQCELTESAAQVKRAEMPRSKPGHRHFLRARASRIAITDSAQNLRLTVDLNRPCPTVVQDTREWKGKVYSAFVALHSGRMSRGTEASLELRLKLTGRADTSPARLTVDASRSRYRLDGFGGNYCFGIESPVTQYTLDNLRVAWARTEMTLPEWEPRNDNASPEETDWAFLQSHDMPDTNLRREFLLAQQIQRRGIPYSITIWHLPEWLYAEPGKGPRVSRRRVAADKWPELLEAIGSYLLYVKKHYGVEPNLFSFNEANIGCRVLFSAEEHRQAIKRIGAHFQALGLKTKMLLADATGPRGTHEYALPAANDPAAMRYVGAVGFHSWGGGSAAEYGAWADLAERLKLPLLVAELGVDAGAWRGHAYDSFHYGLREVRMYQELLLHARPQGTMQWEFTSDYAIVKTRKAPDGQVELEPTARFWFVKHFCNLTPPGATAIETTSDHPKVLFTAFEGTVDGRRHYTCHIANLAAGREAMISGLPGNVERLRSVRTSETEGFRSLPPVEVIERTVKVELAARSLLTLTTLPAEPPGG